MKMNSVHPNLICLPCFPWSSLFVLSFTFSFHFLYAPESFLFLIHFPFFLLFPHAVRELCLFIPHNISFFVSHFPWVSQTCPQNCSVVQGHSCCSQTVFHSTLIFEILIISEALPITWWTSALERIRPQPSILRTEKPIIEKNVPFVEE